MLTVQHRLSGLRAAFLWDQGSRAGRVFAKSYSIPTIDPNRDWEHEGSQAVHHWQGLGITSRLYLHGAALLPELRWGITTLTDQSAAMRRRLHGIDPWRFAAADDPEWHPDDTCLWCLEQGWATLDSASFETHPPWAGRGAIRGANWSQLACLRPSRDADHATKVPGQSQSQHGKGFS